MLPILSIFVLSAIGVLGDYFLKIAGQQKDGLTTKWFIAGMVTYALTAFGWYYVMKHVKLSSVGTLYALSTVLLLTALAVIRFKETLAVPEMVGIGSAILAIILLARFA